MHSIFFLAITYNSFARSSLNNPKFFINNLVDEFNTYISLSLFSFYYLLFLPLTLTLWYFLVWCMNPHILNFRLHISEYITLFRCQLGYLLVLIPILYSFLFRHYYSASYLLLRITTRLRVKKRQQKIRNLYEICTRIGIIILIFLFVFFLRSCHGIENRHVAKHEKRPSQKLETSWPFSL